MLTRRAVVGGLAAAALLPVSARPAVASVAADVAEMLMLGLSGATAGSPSARNLAEHIAAGRVGAVVLRKLNVGSRDEVVGLIRSLKPAGSLPLIAIDHEGGFVQRLTTRHGFTDLPPAREVAEKYTPEQAADLYATSARELASVGINLNLAPVLDLDDPENPAIGHFGRSFGTDPAVIATYAEAFIAAFAGTSIHCAVKHFPGEGRAHDDSHIDLPDITSVWSPQDLEPYVALIADNRIEMVMCGHVRLSTIEKAAVPATLSAAVINGLLRGQLGFRGVVMTDDLDMAGVGGVFGRKESVIRAIEAGNDLLMIGNTGDFDPELPQNIATWIGQAVGAGRLTHARIAESADRVRKLKHSLP